MRDTNRAHSSQLLPGESAYRRAPGFFNTIATDTYIQTVFLVTNEGTLKSSSFKTADMTEHQQCAKSYTEGDLLWKAEMCCVRDVGLQVRRDCSAAQARLRSAVLKI
ncbi:hypothetical protein AV530_012910 [Patagioenas fasciata monilis]|uniref:Uncharacterized protein n=1 Tax=Patagioenas fasciata monilis TaxID=372326 RepID=A0A1V4J9C7_PATFA|nr:hypothetical protein AV530_012910 [Patagioenas fasciata monilis]